MTLKENIEAEFDFARHLSNGSRGCHLKKKLLNKILNFEELNIEDRELMLKSDDISPYEQKLLLILNNIVFYIKEED